MKNIMIIGLFLFGVSVYCGGHAGIPVTKYPVQALARSYQAFLLDERNVDLIVAAAVILGWLDEHEASAYLYAMVVKNHPEKQRDLLKSLGWRTFDAGNPGQAIHYFKAYLMLCPDDKKARDAVFVAQHAYAYQLIKERKIAASLEYFDAMLEQRPNDGDLLMEAARVYGLARDNAQSARLYHRVLLHHLKKTAEVLKPLAWQMILSGQPKGGLAYFNHYLSAHPEDAEALMGLYSAHLAIARHLVHEKKYLKAWTIYSELRRQRPDDDYLVQEMTDISHNLAKNQLGNYPKASFASSN